MNIDNFVIGRVYNCFFKCPMNRAETSNRYAEYTGNLTNPWSLIHSKYMYKKEEVLYAKELTEEQITQILISKLNSEEIKLKCESKNCLFFAYCSGQNKELL